MTKTSRQHVRPPQHGLQYKTAVNACVMDIVKDTIRKWDKAKIFR